jgi:hypothetical protein
VKPLSATEKDAEVSKHIQHLDVLTMAQIKEKNNTVRLMAITKREHIQSRNKIDIEKLWGV